LTNCLKTIQDPRSTAPKLSRLPTPPRIRAAGTKGCGKAVVGWLGWKWMRACGMFRYWLRWRPRKLKVGARTRSAPFAPICVSSSIDIMRGRMTRSMWRMNATGLRRPARSSCPSADSMISTGSTGRGCRSRPAPAIRCR
jgi:hypothetical protein